MRGPAGPAPSRPPSPLPTPGPTPGMCGQRPQCAGGPGPAPSAHLPWPWREETGCRVTGAPLGAPHLWVPPLPQPGTQERSDSSTYCVPGGAPGAGGRRLPFLRKRGPGRAGRAPAGAGGGAHVPELQGPGGRGRAVWGRSRGRGSPRRLRGGGQSGVGQGCSGQRCGAEGGLPRPASAS